MSRLSVNLLFSTLLAAIVFIGAGCRKKDEGAVIELKTRDVNGLDFEGYNAQGFKEGFDRQGFDEKGCDKNGNDRLGFSCADIKKMKANNISWQKYEYLSQELQTKNSTIVDKDQTISSKDEEISEKVKKIAELEESIKKKDQTIEEHEQSLETKPQELKNSESKINEKEQLLANNSQILGAQNRLEQIIESLQAKQDEWQVFSQKENILRESLQEAKDKCQKHCQREEELKASLAKIEEVVKNFGGDEKMKDKSLAKNIEHIWTELRKKAEYRDNKLQELLKTKNDDVAKESESLKPPVQRDSGFAPPSPGSTNKSLSRIRDRKQKSTSLVIQGT